MVFGNPGALWILLVIILILGLGFWGWKVKKEIVAIFKIDSKKIKKSQIKKYLVVGAMLIFLILALAIPQFPLLLPGSAQKTGEIVFLVDVSGSMAATKDLNSPNRLERVKPILYEIIDKFPGAEFYPFHFTSIARSLTPPLTKEDFPYLKSSIANVLDILSAPASGTSIGGALMGVIDKIPKEKNPKLILIFSDGEYFWSYWGGSLYYKPGASTKDTLLDEAIKRAIQEDIKIITIGVGEKEGATIPLYDEEGKFTGEYAKEAGKIYVTSLEEETLKEIASQTGGKYFFESERSGLISYIERNLVSGDMGQEQKDFQDMSYLFLLPVALLWIIFARYYLK